MVGQSGKLYRELWSFVREQPAGKRTPKSRCVRRYFPQP